MNLPEEYICRMRNLLGDEELEQYLAALDEPRLYGLRVNTSKITTEEFEKIAPFPIRKIPYIENGYFYDGEKYQPAKHPYYFAGLYYLQDLRPPGYRYHPGIGCWICVPLRAESRRSWRPAFGEKAFWWPTISVQNGRKLCRKILNYSDLPTR